MITEHTPKSTVLVVDDVLENLHLLTRELTSQGYEVRGVLSGEMALVVAQSAPIDVILLDIRLPDIDGYTVCQRLKANPHTADIPIIFLSALDEPLDKTRAFAVGGVDYITKPFKLVEVIARVETQLKLRQAQRNLQQLNQDLEQRIQERTQALETTNQALQAEIKVRQQAEENLRKSEERYRLIADNMEDLVCFHAADGRFLYVSPSCQTLLGYTPEEMMERHLYDLSHPDDIQCIQLHFQTPIYKGETISSCYRVQHQDGHYIWLETLAKPVLDDSGLVTGIVTSSRDVTQRVKIEKQLRYDSLHDALTDLPNREWLSKRLDLELLQCQRCGDCYFGLLMIDLDRFKAVNDSLGHLTGDRLLVAVANVLKNCVRDVDMVSRWGGDEFVVFLDKVRDVKEAIHVAERIKDALREPLEIDQKIIFTSASIGILMSNNTYRTSNDVFRDVDIALYRAKAGGRNRYEIFGLEMYQEAIAALNLENSLRQAIQNQRFIAHYQPIFCLKTHSLIGFEALARWHHASRGLIMPDVFIDLAEDTGLINRIGEQILAQVCEQIQQWEQEFRLDDRFRISVNVSGQQFRDTNFVQKVDQILAQTGITPQRLKFEITERILLEQSESIKKILADLHGRGIQLSIDDFGTGYSSLRYLSQFSINTLKIDRSFVSPMQSYQQGIVQAIVDLAHNLDMDAVAEGVETEAQLEQLRQLGCEAAQGFFFAQALPPPEATQFISDSLQNSDRSVRSAMTEPPA